MTTPTPTVSVGDATVVEGHSGIRVVMVPVVLDTPATTTLTVRYSITGFATSGPGSAATSGPASAASTSADFKGASGTVSFSPGVVNRTVNVAVYGDARNELDEHVRVYLDLPSAGLALGDRSGTLTILDDDQTPGTIASIGDVTVANGDARTRKINVPITLSQASPGATVTYRVVPGTATGGWSGVGTPPMGVDVGSRSGAQTVTFTTTSVRKNISVVLPGDLQDEPDETVAIVIDAVTGATQGRDGLLTIVDDDLGDADFGASTTPVGSLVAGSTLVGCAQKDTRIVATASIHLDPSCTYTRGITVQTSNVTVDCRGASIVKDPVATETQGILVQAPTDTAIHDVTVRNCNVSGFGNNLHIQRQGFKTLVAGSEYVNASTNLLVENNTFSASINTGVFVNAFVTDVTFTHNTVTGSGAVGIYLEAGSKGNELSANRVTNNGYKDVVPGPASFQLGATTVYYLSTGREGIAVDGSRDNAIRDNLVSDNAAGGIFLYKNCGEDASKAGHWVRLYGSTGNVLRHNVVRNGRNGIWVGSRAAENQYFMDCSDTPIVSNPGGLQAVYLDPASSNLVEDNLVEGMTNGIRVEANDVRVRSNTVTGGTRGVLVGSKYLTTVLATPIAGTDVSYNSTASVTTPYSWIWGKGTLTFVGNAGNGGAGRLVEGTQPAIDPFLFVLSFV